MDAVSLLRWYAANGRHALPWRSTTDPYTVLVSEVMLQQTQVDRVLPKYHQFLTAFPTFAALAEAPLAEVIRCWQGLGYNRRAVNLHRIARVAAERGGLPADPAELRRLPGIGVYTAAAIASFAHGRDVAMVDTNIRRVLGRALLGDAAPTDAAARRLAAPRLPPGRGRDWNLALMDLGAMVCTARAPACSACPLAQSCVWNAAAPRALREFRAPYRPAERFVGSRRYYRGRIVDALRALSPGASLSLAVLGPAARPDYDDAQEPWLADLLAALARDGLVTLDEQGVQLP
ncbi:MAG: A/G-specific adenine glycosylase [Dehalococcoidia bacterium]|nr:A/G-specific adenine glycosylase [Dehalococcoidia bacterium]